MPHFGLDKPEFLPEIKNRFMFSKIRKNEFIM